MSGFLIGLFTFILVLASLFLILLVLLQRGSGQGGMGAAFGGGMAESAFGGDTNKVLTRATVVTSVLFFVVGLGLYMAQIAQHKADTEAAVNMQEMVEAADEQAAAKIAASQSADTTTELGEVTTKAMEVLDKEVPQANAAIAPEVIEESAQTVEASKKAQTKAGSSVE